MSFSAQHLEIESRNLEALGKIGKALLKLPLSFCPWAIDLLDVCPSGRLPFLTCVLFNGFSF